MKDEISIIDEWVFELNHLNLNGELTINTEEAFLIVDDLYFDQDILTSPVKTTMGYILKSEDYEYILTKEQYEEIENLLSMYSKQK